MSYSSNFIKETPGEFKISDKPNILLYVADQEKEDRIRHTIGDQFKFRICETHLKEKQFDLCIFDLEIFENNRGELLAYKKEGNIGECPFLLFLKDDVMPDTSHSVWDMADDVISASLPTHLITSRIESLLELRFLSQENKRSQSIFRQAINATERGILFTDPTQEGNPIIYANKGFQEITGYDEEEILGKNCRFLQGDDRDQPAIDKIRTLVERGEPGSVVLRNYRKDGTLFWNELSIAPIENEKGDITHFMGVQQDVTKLVETQEKLTRERDRYQLIMDRSSDVISIHSPEGDYRWVTPSIEDLTGYTPDELEGKSAYDLFHPDDLEDLAKEHEKFKSGKKDSVFVEYRIKNKEGGYTWVETHSKVVREPESTEILSIQNSTRDISERKKYEQELKEEKEFLNSVVNNMPGIFYMLDSDLNFVFWNNNLEKEFGYSHEEVARMHPFEFFSRENVELIQKKVLEVIEEGSAEVEVEIIGKQGDAMPYYLNATRLQREGKTYLIGSGVNISERLDAEFKSVQRDKLLNAIINQSESVVYVKDAEGRLRLVNESYLELFGMDYEEVIGKTDRELHGEELTANVQGNDRLVLEEGKTLEVEEQIPLSRGIRHFLTIKYPLDDVPGFENCLCGISTDITERKQTLNKLQERVKEQTCLFNIAKLNGQPRSIEELLSRSVVYLPDGWQYPEITEACIEYEGYRYYTEDYRETEWMIQNNTKNVHGKELRVRVVYLQEKPMLYEGPFLKEERQLIDAISDMLASQIERITSVIKLKESEKRWEELVENDPDLIQILDGTEIKFVNEAGVRMYGAADKEELIGKSFLDLVTMENPELAKERIRKVMDGETVPAQIHKIEAMDGVTRYIEVQSVPIIYEEGQQAVQVVGKDVTDRIEYEERLQESLREKEVLLQEIHHRVKNNLAVISGLLHLQRFSSENEAVGKVLSESAMRVKSMALIHEKLYKSHSLSEIDLKNYIEDLSSNIQEVMDVNDKVAFEFDCESITINVNQAVPCALLLNEIVNNSLEHAFPDQQEGRIMIQLRQEEDRVFVHVKDDGVGLPDDFNREDAESMGFTIINTLVKQLKAELDIYNEEGTHFSFSFEKRTVKGSSSTLI